MALTFDSESEGLPIASLVVENKPPTYLYLAKEKEMKHRRHVDNIFEYLDPSFISKNRLDTKELIKLKKAIDNNDTSDLKDGELFDIFRKMERELANRTNSEVNLNYGRLVPVPDYKTRDTYYISGMSGCGKSHLASEICKQFLKVWPDRPIYMFSRVSKDPSFDRLGSRVTRIIINEEWLDNPPQVENIEEDSMCVFDDIDTIEPKEVKKLVIDLQNQILQVGRHRNIYCISTTHKMCNYRGTQVLIEEARKICFFPRGGGSMTGINRILRDYLGLDRKTILRLSKLPSRWVMVSKQTPTLPMYCIHEKGCFIVK